jgi:Plavaka transposase
MILKTGIYITCTDGKIRVYYPIILSIIADYEEQVVIIGIKNLR